MTNQGKPTKNRTIFEQTQAFMKSIENVKRDDEMAGILAQASFILGQFSGIVQTFKQREVYIHELGWFEGHESAQENRGRTVDSASIDRLKEKLAETHHVLEATKYD